MPNAPTPYFVYSDINRDHPKELSCMPSLKKAVNTAFLIFVPTFFGIGFVSFVGFVFNNFVCAFACIKGRKKEGDDDHETLLDNEGAINDY